jgi:hypothetical protein
MGESVREKEEDARGEALMNARVQQLLRQPQRLAVCGEMGVGARIAAPALAGDLEAEAADEALELHAVEDGSVQDSRAARLRAQPAVAAGDAWLWLDDLERQHEELRAALAGLARAGGELGRCAADQLLPWAGTATALAPTCGLGPRAAAVVARHRALAEEVAAAAALRRRAAEAASAGVPPAAQARLDRARREMGAVALATASG